MVRLAVPAWVESMPIGLSWRRPQGCSDIQNLIATVTDSRLAQRLVDAIDGRGAFRRFYNIIDSDPAEHTRWQRYSDDARLGRARGWLADHGYQPIPQ